MVEQFIERGTEFMLRNGKLTIYETNCVCKDIQFYFDHYVLTIMLRGHKTIKTDHLKFEFFPSTFFIPERGVINNVSIPNASIYNPTQCLVLEINPLFIKKQYEKILYSELDKEILYDTSTETTNGYFLSNDQLLIQSFMKLYTLQSKDKSSSKTLVEDLIITEMLYRVFSTEGLHLLKRNFDKTIQNDKIYKVVNYIDQHLSQKIKTTTLAKVAGLGQTTFFKVFKEATGQSPIDYLMNERIKKAKILLQKNRSSLQEIAYECGFNSYEYFCSSFKKIEQLKPSEYKKGILQKQL